MHKLKNPRKQKLFYLKKQSAENGLAIMPMKIFIRPVNPVTVPALLLSLLLVLSATCTTASAENSELSDLSDLVPAILDLDTVR